MMKIKPIYLFFTILIAVSGLKGADNLTANPKDSVAACTDNSENASSLKPEPKKTKVALFRIEEAISDTTGLQGGLLSACRDESVKAIFLIINSYGGSPEPAHAVGELIAEIRIYKPVVTFISSYCYSAAYLIASFSDMIICPKYCAVGSIGAYIHVEKHEKTRANGQVKGIINNFVFVAGKYKALGHPHTPLTDESKDRFQREAQECYDIFCEVVAKNRGLNLENREEWAEGKNFYGNKALEIGLIDATGSMFDCAEALKKLIKEKFPEEEISTELEIFEVNYKQSQNTNNQNK